MHTHQQALDKATKSIYKASDKTKAAIDSADAKLKKAQADAEVCIYM